MYQSWLRSNQKKNQETKEENSAISNSGCKVKFLAVADHLNNVQPTTKTTNEKYPNGQIIKCTMESELDLTMLEYTARKVYSLLT